VDTTHQAFSSAQEGPADRAATAASRVRRVRRVPTSNSPNNWESECTCDKRHEIDDAPRRLPRAGRAGRGGCVFFPIRNTNSDGRAHAATDAGPDACADADADAFPHGCADDACADACADADADAFPDGCADDA
jgi:hypothetical protein